MKKLLTGLFAAAVACGVNAQNSSGFNGFIEAGPGVLSHSGTIANGMKVQGGQFGGQIAAGMYFAQSELGALRLAGSVGYYTSGSGNRNDRNKNAIDGYTVPVLADLAYEFNLSPVRLRLGPAAGFTNIDWRWNERVNYGWFSMNLPRGLTGTTFTYGGQLGLSVDFSESVYAAADYKYLRFTDSKVSDDNVHAFLLSLGFRF